MGNASHRDSVGVVTHIVYYDTAYGDWTASSPGSTSSASATCARASTRTPLRAGATGTSATTGRSSSPPHTGSASPSAQPARAAGTGTLDQILAVVGGRLRNAAEALEAPNEFDKYVGGRRWPSVLSSYARDLHRKAKALRSLRGLPILGSLVRHGRRAEPGRQPGQVARRRQHPPVHGRAVPRPAPHQGRARARRRHRPDKPVWATEAGFHNAMRAPEGEQAPVSEAAGAVYMLRTFLEHFDDGIRRTYAYELLDEKPDRSGRNPEQHFGLLRNDFSRKPAFNALRNLLTVVGRDDRRPSLRPLRIELSGDRRRAPARAPKGRRHLRRRALAPGQRLGPRSPPPGGRVAALRQGRAARRAAAYTWPTRSARPRSAGCACAAARARRARRQAAAATRLAALTQPACAAAISGRPLGEAQLQSPNLPGTPMRILFVNHTSAASGAEFALMRLITGVRRKHHVAVACPATGPLADLLDDAAVQHVPDPRLRGKPAPRPGPDTAQPRAARRRRRRSRRAPRAGSTPTSSTPTRPAPG